MSSLSINGAGCVFMDAEGERTLLDCTNFLANKSRVSMHRLPGQPHPIIPEILWGLIQKLRTEADELTIPFGVLDSLLTARLIRSSKPVRLLEYGSGQGALSAHLAQLLGTFHEKSSLVCAYDTIELEWMDRISHVEHPPALSFLACDFGHSGLQEQSFDIVVLNGLADFPQPYDVVKEATSLVKADGLLLCYIQDTPLLESTFKLFFEDREEYEFSPSCKVMSSGASQCSWRETDVPDLAVTVEDDFAKAAELSADSGHEACARMLDQLQEDLRAAVEQGEAALKIQLLAVKEQLLENITRS